MMFSFITTKILGYACGALALVIITLGLICKGQQSKIVSMRKEHDAQVLQYKLQAAQLQGAIDVSNARVEEWKHEGEMAKLRAIQADKDAAQAATQLGKAQEKLLSMPVPVDHAERRKVLDPIIVNMTKGWELK